MNNNSLLLLPFVPDHIKQQLTETLTVQWPRVQHCSAVISIVDLSGYTKATRELVEEAENFAQREGRGHAIDARNASQYIGSMVKHFLDPLFERIVHSGGDIVKFGGDSVIILWMTDSSHGKSSQEAIALAVQCCIDAACFVRQHPLLDLNNQVMDVAVHGVVHFGEVTLLQLGDSHLQRAESVCYGEDFVLACDLLNQSHHDQVLVTKEALSQLKGFVPKRTVSNVYDENFTCFNIDIRDPVDSIVSSSKLLHENLSESMLQEALYYVDASLQPRLPSSQKYKDLHEIRQVTVSFIRLTYQATDGGVVSRENTTYFAFQLQEYLIQALQEADEHKTGLLRQLAVDDKGITLLLLFGLPPYTTENACISAATVTTRLLRLFRVGAFRASAGIASGRVFTGVIGCDTRMEHAVLGNAVNLAARLMMRHEAQDDILCDATTASRLPAALLETTPLPEPILFKGWSKPMTVFTVTELQEARNEEFVPCFLSPTQKTSVKFHDTQDDLVWQRPIENWLKATEAVSFVIEGTSGSGKTCTALRMIEFVRERNIPVWEFSSFEIECSVPFHTLRTIASLLQNLFQTHSAFAEWRDEEQRRFDVLISKSSEATASHEFMSMGTSTHAAVIERQRHILGFLSHRFGLDASFIQRAFSDLHSILSRSADGSLTDRTSRLTVAPEELMQRLDFACISLLNGLASKCPLAILCDDCQWQDRYSWILTHSLVSRCPNVLVIVISRPSREYADPNLKEIYATVCAKSIHIPIGVISQQRLITILSEILEKPESSVRRLAMAMYELSGGNAFAVDVLLKHLQSGDADADALLQADPATILPQDMNDVFVTQLDRLDSQFQSIVRMAALIGQVFRLCDVLDLCNLKGITSEMVQQWDKYGFLEQMRDGDSHRWRFRHCLIAYQISFLMTSHERKSLHEQIGQYYLGLLQHYKGTRRPEILPIIHQQFLAAENNEMTFLASCKLMSMYYKLEMFYETRRHFLQWVENNSLFEQKPEMKRLKLYSLGLESSAMCEDGITVRRLFKPCLSLCGINFPKCKLMQVIYVLQLILDHKNYWNKGKIPSIRLPENSVLKRLALLRMVITKCSTVLDLSTGKRAGLEYAIPVVAMHNLHIVYRHLLPEALFTEMTMLGIAMLLAFKNAVGAKNSVDFLGLDHKNLDKNRVIQAIDQCQYLPRHELDQLTDFGRFGQYFGICVFFTNYSCTRAVEELRSIWEALLRLNWLSGWNSTMSGCASICLMSGQHDMILDYIRRLRKYLEDNPGVAVHSQDVFSALSTVAGILGEWWPIKCNDREFVLDVEFCWQLLSKHANTTTMFSLENTAASGRFRLAMMKGELDKCISAIDSMDRCLNNSDPLFGATSILYLVGYSLSHILIAFALSKYSSVKLRILAFLRKWGLKNSFGKSGFESSTSSQSQHLCKILLSLDNKPQQALNIVCYLLPLARGVSNTYFEAGLLTTQYLITKDKACLSNAIALFKTMSCYWSEKELQFIE